MPLTDTAVRNAKPQTQPYKISDSGRLHLLIQTNGAKLWRLAYRFAGKQKTLALGGYPAVTLQKARNGRDDARQLLADGRDPSVQKRQEKVAARLGGDATFKALALEYLSNQRHALSPIMLISFSADLRETSSHRLAGVRSPKSMRWNCSMFCVRSRNAAR